MTRGQRVFTHTLCFLFTLLCSSTIVKANEDWSITVYGAVLTGDTLEDTLHLASDFDESYYLMSLAVGRRVASFKKYVDYEIEGQIVKHFGNQDHMEFNMAVMARWLTFPWNSYIDTGFAVGGGLSFATKTPEIEKLHHDETSQLLSYLLFELAFSLPNSPKWSFVARIHHRSGAYGIFDNVYGASNALGLGIKYTF